MRGRERARGADGRRADRDRVAPDDLDEPEAVVTAWDEIIAVRRLLARLPDDVGVGVDVGSRFKLTHAGLLGFAAMSCATLREMFDIDMRYFSLTTLHIDLKLFDGAQDCMLELNVDHLPADVRRFFIERDLAAIVSTVGAFAYEVVERYADKVTAEVSLDEDVLSPLLTLVPVDNIAFERAHTRLYFPRAMFDEPLAAGRSAHARVVHGPVRCADAAQRAASRYHGRGARPSCFATPAAFRACPRLPPNSMCTRARCAVSSPRRVRRFVRC